MDVIGFSIWMLGGFLDVFNQGFYMDVRKVSIWFLGGFLYGCSCGFLYLF